MNTATGYAGQPQTVSDIRESSEVEGQSRRVTNALEMLMVALKHHRDRLQPIVRPMPPKPPQAETKVRGIDGPMSPLGDAMRTSVGHIEQLAYELNELTDSLAV